MSLADFLILSTALLIGWSCALLGCFLVLQKVVMIGDAISHSVLPGIVLAFVFSSGFDSVFILLGAAVFGVLTSMIIRFFSSKLKLQEDASIGITFTWLFGLGIIFIAAFTGSNADIDKECVLFGELGTTFLDKIIIKGYLIGTRSIWLILPVLLLIIAFITFGFNKLKVISFHADYAQSKGISVSKWHYAFMLLVSITSVMSFEAVGAVLVVGLLAIPPATAYLLVKRLQQMIFLSLIFSTTCCILGYMLANYWDVSMSPSIVMVCGFQFLIVLIVTQVRKRIFSKAAVNFVVKA